MFEQVGWEHATANVMALLLAGACQGGPRGGGDFSSGTNHKIVGSWAGNRVAWFGDYSEREDYPTLTDEEFEQAMKEKGYTDVSDQVAAAYGEEFGVQYSGDGWRSVAAKDKKVTPKMKPDFVIRS